MNDRARNTLSQWRALAHRAARVLRTAACCLALSGCFVVYQPLASLQRPVAVDPELANLEGLRIDVTCKKGEFLTAEQTQLLCRKVGRLLENQGAKVRTQAELGAAALADEEDDADAEPADLRVDLSARLLHQEKNTLLWVLSFGTLTLLPAWSEYTFAQDVTIRDRSGFLLASDSLQGRFIRYFGASLSVVNWMLDLLVREEHEKFTRSRVERDFTRDFYGQVSQLVFNARQKLALLQSFEAGR